MSMISLKTLVANALWKRQSEVGKGYILVSELEYYARNVLEKIEEKKKELNIGDKYKYSIKVSLNSIKNSAMISNCFYVENDKIYIDKSKKNWETNIINLKNYYKKEKIINYAFNNSDVPVMEMPLLKIYDSNNYEHLFKEIDKEIKNVHNQIEGMQQNPEPVLKKYFDLHIKLKELEKDKFQAKIEFFDNCNHSLFYLDINNKRNKECKCLSCGRLSRVDDIGSSLHIATTETFEKVKELYQVVSELTNCTEVIRNVIIEDLG